VHRFRHSLVDELTLNYEALVLLADPDHVLVVYAAEAGSPSQDAASSMPVEVELSSVLEAHLPSCGIESYG
jgi:MmyB-like transcription regulator ligand binding domain